MKTWNVIEDKFGAEQIPNMKKAFARIYVKNNEDREKTFVDRELSVLFGSDNGCKLYAINYWLHDPDVEQEINFLINGDGVNKTLPTKSQVAREIYLIAQQTYNPKDKLQALQMYANLMGFNDDTREETGANAVTQNVILVTDNGSDLTWEEKLKNNQHTLQEQADRLLAENETK